jgi:hypothetical protein
MAHFEEDEEHNSVLQKHNRVLRKVNKVLRNSHKVTKDYNDALFRELCETDKEAELAMEKLWTLGGFELICGPKDYNTVVETCLAALRARKR